MPAAGSPEDHSGRWSGTPWLIRTGPRRPWTELARPGVAALAGEYHSVVARAVAARADALDLPFLCSSAVLDALTEQPAQWVARLAPAQSHGWRIHADFLLGAGRDRIAAAAEPSVYWASGSRILRDHLTPRGGTVIELDMSALTPAAVCDALVDHRATALLLLVGHPEPAVSIVRSVRRDRRLAGVVVGAPAGQPPSLSDPPHRLRIQRIQRGR